MAFVSGSSKLLSSGFLEVFSGFVYCGAPFGSITGTLFQLLWFKVAPLEVGLYSVFVSLLGTALVSLSMLELTVQQTSWDSVVFHADHVTHPAELCFDQHGLDARRVSSLEDFGVGDTVLPANSQY